MGLKFAFVSPDGQSTLQFCKTFCRVLGEKNEVCTISPLDQCEDEITMLESEHKEVDLNRFVNPISDIKYLFKLYKIFKAGNFDNVINFTTKPNIYGSIAAKIARVNCVVIAVRGLGRMFGEPGNLREKILQFFVKKLYRVACRCADHVWFTNEYDREIFLSLKITEKNKTFVTTNAIDLEDFSSKNVPIGAVQDLREELGIASTKSVVIMVARLIWAKGIKEYLESAEILREVCPDLQFILVAPSEEDGPGSVPQSYVRQMEEKSNFIWLEFRKDIRTFYAMADLAVLPSYYQEGGYPRALLEPMAFGKPVIAGDTDFCRGPVEHGKNGLLVSVKNSKELAEAIASIIMNADKRKMWGEYSMSKVQREFDDKNVIDLVLRKIR